MYLSVGVGKNNYKIQGSQTYTKCATIKHSINIEATGERHGKKSNLF